MAQAELRGLRSAPVGHADRRAAEAAKFGLRHVISPERAPTLREALRAVLPARAPQAA